MEIKRNKDKKFDISLSKADKFEQEFCQLFSEKKIELKTECDWWQKTGNICIELSDSGKPSGITSTEADYWAHELRDGETTVCYMVFPVEILKKIVDKSGKKRNGIGDGGRIEAVLLPIKKVFEQFMKGKEDNV